MINSPFWVAHNLLWIFWLIGKIVKNKNIKTLCDHFMFGCLGAMIMWMIMAAIG